MKKPKIVHNWDDLPMLLSVEQTAIILDIVPSYVCTKCREGVLPAKQLGRTWYIDRDRLRAMLGQAAPGIPSEPDQLEAFAQRVAAIVVATLKGA